MSANPSFTSTPRIGPASLSTANTARDGTGTIATVITAVAAGTKIFEVIAVGTADVADSSVTLFLHDGTNFWYFDEIDVGNPAAASATVAPLRFRRTFDNLVLPSGWSLRAALTAVTTSGVVNVFALGGDLT